MGYKGSWHRPHSKKEWDECPLWDNIEKKKQAPEEETMKKDEKVSDSTAEDV